MQECSAVRRIPKKLTLSAPTRAILEGARSATFASTIRDLEDLACGGRQNQEWTVSYTLPDGRRVPEVVVNRVRNGNALAGRAGRAPVTEEKVSPPATGASPSQSEPAGVHGGGDSRRPRQAWR